MTKTHEPCYQPALHCDSCDSKMHQPLYCHACERLQQQRGEVNYFQLFNLQLSYAIDREKIVDHFDELIVSLHPDFYAQGSEQEQVLSLEYTTLLNQAQDVLLDSFERGKYLLSLIKPLQGEVITNPPQNFIMEMFEIQEDLDLLADGKGDTDKMEQSIAFMKEGVEKELVDQFMVLTNNTDDQAMLDSIRGNLGKMKFLQNLEDRFQSIRKTL